MTARRFALIDRDGTINVERRGSYVLSPADMRLIPGAAEGLRALTASGVGIAVVSNQAPVARGWIDARGLDAINSRMLELLSAEGVEVEGVYCCPHDTGDGCDCRKPEPGLILRAGSELGFDPSTAFVVGDKESDIEAGRRAGARTVLVLTGQGIEALAAGTDADHVAADLLEAAAIIAATPTPETR